MTDAPRGPTTEAPTGAATYRCDQCGRIGTRGYEWLHVQDGTGYGHIVLCASRRACQRRYERQRPAWMDE